jgi:hypothetical protein
MTYQLSHMEVVPSEFHLVIHCRTRLTAFLEALITLLCLNLTVLSASVCGSPRREKLCKHLTDISLDIANSPDGKSILPVFGSLFTNEPVPHGGSLDVSDAPGFGLELNPNVNLIPADRLIAPDPSKPLGPAGEEGKEK